MEGYRSEIINAPEFEIKFKELAAKYSDCSSARPKPFPGAVPGDLGWFGKGKMQPEFENAALELQVGELSGIVESKSGVHIIWRMG